MRKVNKRHKVQGTRHKEEPGFKVQGDKGNQVTLV